MYHADSCIEPSLHHYVTFVTWSYYIAGNLLCFSEHRIKISGNTGTTTQKLMLGKNRQNKINDTNTWLRVYMYIYMYQSSILPYLIHHSPINPDWLVVIDDQVSTYTCIQWLFMYYIFCLHAHCITVHLYCGFVYEITTKATANCTFFSTVVY